MNQNIHVINSCFNIVNFDYVDYGFIKELKFVQVDPKKSIAVTEDGRIVLNNQIKDYELFIPYILGAMQLEQREINTKHGFCRVLRMAVPDTAELDDKTIMHRLSKGNYKNWNMWSLYEKVCGWENCRRMYRIIWNKKHNN